MTQQYQLPAHLLARTSKTVGAAIQNNLGKNSPPYLSIAGGRFTLVDAVGNQQPVQTYDPQLGPFIDINIIDANENVSKVYWGPDSTYNPNETTFLPPVCYSDNGIGPSRNSAEPQAPTCLQCPNSAWGSAVSRVTGKGIKACTDLQKIAFTTAGHNTVFLLRVPPNSLKNLGAYQGSFGGQPIDISDVVTRISFVPGILGTLQFQATNYIDVPTAQQREEAVASKATDSLVGRNDTVHPGAAQLSAPAHTQALPAPAAPIPMAPIQQISPLPVNMAPMQPITPLPAQQAPFPTQQSPATTAPVQQPNFVVGQPGAAAPPPVPPKRGRPAKPAPAAPAAQQPARTPFPVNGPGPAGAAQVQPGAQFGITPGLPPNAEIASALNQLFPPAQQG